MMEALNAILVAVASLMVFGVALFVTVGLWTIGAFYMMGMLP